MGRKREIVACDHHSSIGGYYNFGNKVLNSERLCFFNFYLLFGELQSF